jgi:hypothetical protein
MTAGASTPPPKIPKPLAALVDGSARHASLVWRRANLCAEHTVPRVYNGQLVLYILVQVYRRAPTAWNSQPRLHPASPWVPASACGPSLPSLSRGLPLVFADDYTGIFGGNWLVAAASGCGGSVGRREGCSAAPQPGSRPGLWSPLDPGRSGRAAAGSLQPLGGKIFNARSRLVFCL